MGSHYSDDFRFRPRRKSAGFYVNTGQSSFSIQQDAGTEPDPRLIEAIKAAHDAFWAVYRPRTSDS